MENISLPSRASNEKMPAYGIKQLIVVSVSCTIIFGAQFLNYLI